jgi:hypothetical protein
MRSISVHKIKSKLVLFWAQKKIQKRKSEYSEFSKFEFLADLSFLLRLKYKDFRIIFLHTCRSHNDLRQDFLSNFF